MRIAQINGLGKVWGSFHGSVLDQPDKTVGGGEAALLRTSFELARFGHQVTCYIPTDADHDHNGVHFVPIQRRMEAIDQADAIVGWNDDEILIACAQQRPGVRRVFSQQLNHMNTQMEFWQATDVIVSPARMHAEYLVGSFAPAGAPFRFVIMPSGIDRWRYTNRPSWQSRGHVVSYWSSPDRGLHHLMRIWPRILQQIPDADLRIFYHLRRYAFARQAWEHGEGTWRSTLLKQLIACTPGFTAYGAVSRSVLAKHQMQTRVMAYPLDPLSFTESFATSIGEALAAGCRVVAHPADAIKDVWGSAVRWIDADFCDDDFRDRFDHAVHEALTNPEWPEDAHVEVVLGQYTWENAARQIEKACTVNPLPPAARR